MLAEDLNVWDDFDDINPKNISEVYILIFVLWMMRTGIESYHIHLGLMFEPCCRRIFYIQM